MAYSPIQLDIIRTFGSKELSEGCIISIDGKIEQPASFSMYGYPRIWNNDEEEYELYMSSDFEILGHIPELFPDVARVAKEKGINIEIRILPKESSKFLIVLYWNNPIITKIPYNPTLPLIDQDESTLIPLLNLLGTPLTTLA